MDGTQLLNLLRQNPEVRTMLLMANMVADVDMVVKSIKGDVAIRMPQLSTIDTELTLVAEISTSSFLDQVIEWGDEASTQGSIRFIPSVNGAYLCAYGGKAYYFGATDEHLYITNKAEDINPTFATYTPEGERLRICADLTSVADLLTFVPALSSLQTLRQVTITLR